MAIDRDIALSARADHGSPQLDLARVVDVVEIDAVVVADKQVVAAEGQIGIGGAVLDGRRPAPRPLPRQGAGGGARRRGAHHIAGSEARRLRQSGNPLQAERRFAGVVQSAFESHARIVAPAPRIGIDLGRGGRGLGGLARRRHGIKECQ